MTAHLFSIGQNVRWIFPDPRFSKSLKDWLIAPKLYIRTYWFFYVFWISIENRVNSYVFRIVSGTFFFGRKPLPQDPVKKWDQSKHGFYCLVICHFVFYWHFTSCELGFRCPSDFFTDLIFWRGPGGEVFDQKKGAWNDSKNIWVDSVFDADSEYVKKSIGPYVKFWSYQSVFQRFAKTRVWENSSNVLSDRKKMRCHRSYLLVKTAGLYLVSFSKYLKNSHTHGLFGRSIINNSYLLYS
jgi:hypothetical protein